MSDRVTVTEAIARLKDFGGKVLPRATKTAIYRAMDLGKQRALDALAQARIGTMVRRRGEVQMRLQNAFIGPTFGPRTSSGTGSTIPLIVQRVSVKESSAFSFGARSYTSGLRTYGFASLIETGGRTRAHTIKPIRAFGYSRRRRVRARQLLAEQPMRFQIGGRWVSARIVSHPGSRIPKTPVLDRGVSAARQALVGEFERAAAEAVAKARL